MPKPKQQRRRMDRPPSVTLTYGNRRLRLLLDKLLVFKFFQHLHGRFWGITGILGMLAGFWICFLIRPEMLQIATPISEFGNDVRTAPYFSGSVFFCAYAIWRWRSYLARTWRRTHPVTGLLAVTVAGLYLIALMPIGWEPVYRIHIFGVVLAGAGMFATVLLDGILTKTRRSAHSASWRVIRLVSICSILCGGWLTFGSAKIVGWYNVSLLGEGAMLLGYVLWICQKTYQGEGNRTVLARLLKRIVLID